MTRILDYSDLGVMPLQHHEEGVLTGRRYQAAGVRLAKGPDIRSDASSEDGLLRIATVEGKGTIGDIHPVGYWQTKARDQRATGSWSPLFASLVSSVGSTPGQTTASPGGPSMRPVSGAWVQDVRYSEKEGAWPSGIQRMPKNTMSLAVFGTDETRQRDLMATVDPRLFAPTTEGPADCGTLVVDLQGTGEPCMENSSEPGVGGRAARLQSMMRVIPLSASSSGPMGVGPGNAIAWNLAASRRDNLAGYGLVFGMADAAAVLTQPTTGGGGGGSGPPITGVPSGGTYLPPPGFGQPGVTIGSAPLLLAAVQAGAGSSGGGSSGGYSGPGDTVGYGDISVFESGHFIPKPQPAHASALMAQLGGGGPLHVGNVADKHRISIDRDGNAINAGHISTRAYFYDNQQRDAPLAFGGNYPNPPQLPLRSRVHLAYDRFSTHTHRGLAKEGMWRWYAETHVLVPTGTPDDEDDPPKPPITGEPTPQPQPPTTGGGPPIPGAPTTGGGGGGGGPTTGGGSGGPSGGPGGGGGGPGGTPSTGGTGSGQSPPTGGGAKPATGAPDGSGSGTGGGAGSDPDGPDEPPEPTNPYGEESNLRDGDPPVDIDNPEQNPMLNPDDLPRDEDGRIDHDRLDEWRERVRRRRREWHRLVWEKHFGDRDDEEREDATVFVGQMHPDMLGLFSIFHPMNEGFAALNFRPQLMSQGYPMFEHNPNLGDELPEDEKQRPQVLAAHAWGAQTADNDWDYQRRPNASRARGGVANGGLLLHPPCMELEDYANLAGVNMDTSQPLTTGYLAFAQGTCLGFGSPDFSTGGLAPGGVSVGQGGGSGKPMFVMQSDSGGTGHTIATFEYDLDDGVPRFEALGTGAMAIPRGTTAQRPSFNTAGGELRYNADNNRVEFYDDSNGAFIPLLSSFGDDVGDLNMATDRLLGRTTAGTGAVETIQVGTGLSLASGVLSATGGSGGVIDAVSGNPHSSVSETADSSSANIYSYTLPADTLASGKSVRVTLLGAIIQNSGADQNARLRVRLGGTEYAESAASRANDADPYGFKIVVDIAWTTSSTQYIRIDIEQAGAFTSASGYGNLGASTDGILWALGSEDNTTSLLFEVRGTFDTTATSSTWAVYSAQTEVLG